MDLDDLRESHFPRHHPISRNQQKLTFSIEVDNAYALGGSDDERERAEKAVLMEELERKKRLRKMAVPTDDKKVRERLRAYGEPITLFGEGVSLA